MIELLVVIAISGILAAIAIPNLGSFLDRGNAWSEVSTLQASLGRARSEATTRGLPVTLCASNDGATCLGGAAWQTGWILFTDRNGNAGRDPGDALIDVQSAADARTVVTANGVGTLATVTFSPTGRATTGVTSFSVVAGPASPATTRTLCLNVAGRTRVLQKAEACS